VSAAEIAEVAAVAVASYVAGQWLPRPRVRRRGLRARPLRLNCKGCGHHRSYHVRGTGPCNYTASGPGPCSCLAYAGPVPLDVPEYYDPREITGG